MSKVICSICVVIAIFFLHNNALGQQDTAGSTTRPGATEFTPAQDSAYQKAKELNISPYVRFFLDLQRYSELWTALKERQRKDPLNIMTHNIDNIPPELYIPTGKELVRHQYNIAMSQQTGLPAAIPVTPGAGLQMPLSAIGAFLGIGEDVSPELSYTLETSSDVEIVIYSVQALVIKTLLKARQFPGKYNLTWDARNDVGNRVPPGDYVAEIRIGKERVIRKRIIIP